MSSAELTNDEISRAQDEATPAPKRERNIFDPPPPEEEIIRRPRIVREFPQLSLAVKALQFLVFLAMFIPVVYGFTYVNIGGPVIATFFDYDQANPGVNRFLNVLVMLIFLGFGFSILLCCLLCGQVTTLEKLETPLSETFLNFVDWVSGIPGMARCCIEPLVCCTVSLISFLLLSASMFWYCIYIVTQKIAERVQRTITGEVSVSKTDNIPIEVIVLDSAQEAQTPPRAVDESSPELSSVKGSREESQIALTRGSQEPII